MIDFPGVDDRDETIPDLAELLLALAQVVVFVVDYRYTYWWCIIHVSYDVVLVVIYLCVCVSHSFSAQQASPN